MAFPYIVADIGGTNARFALVTGLENHTNHTDGTIRKTFIIEQTATFKCSEFSEFEDVYQSYLDTLTESNVAKLVDKVCGACVAIAGPVSANRVVMTNLDWSFSGDDLKNTYGYEFFYVINDFAAQAMAVVSLASSDLFRIKSSVSELLSSESYLPKAVLGPGTGLGVASLVHNGTAWMPISGEGGHANFAPVTALDIELYKYMRGELSYVSVETLLCGSGITRIYKALAAINDEVIEEESSLPENVTESAKRGSDKMATSTLDVFFRVLGSASGNIALTVGARGGVYLTGGILPRVKDLLLESDFNQAFCSKGVMSHYVETLNVDLVIHNEPALIGGASYVESKLVR